MKAAVLSAFLAFSTRFEGNLPFLYLDVKGLVTTAIGILVEPVEVALGLPWLRNDGTPATEAEITDAWLCVKGYQQYCKRGGVFYGKFTTLRLSAHAIDNIVLSRVDEFTAVLMKRFPGLEGWPADAQLGLLSMAWALGPAFRFPMFASFASSEEWEQAAVQSHIDDAHNPGLTPRNAANRTLFQNAAVVRDQALDPDVLYWPRDLATERITPAS